VTTWAGRCRVCTATVKGSHASHCPVCHRTFLSHKIADAHRIGAVDTAERRCLTTAEMRDRGWRARRYRNGWAWVGADMPESVIRTLRITAELGRGYTRVTPRGPEGSTGRT